VGKRRLLLIQDNVVLLRQNWLIVDEQQYAENRAVEGAPGRRATPRGRVSAVRSFTSTCTAASDAFGTEADVWGRDITRRCRARGGQCVTVFTEELPWLKGRRRRARHGRAKRGQMVGWSASGECGDGAGKRDEAYVICTMNSASTAASWAADGGRAKDRMAGCSRRIYTKSSAAVVARGERLRRPRS